MALPKTGIEQPFMTFKPKFRQDNKEFEPTHCMSQVMSDEFARLDGERLANPSIYSY